MNGAREIKIVFFIRKLIKEHKKYINYRVSDEGFIVFMVFNYYYEVMKRIHQSTSMAAKKFIPCRLKYEI